MTQLQNLLITCLYIQPSQELLLSFKSLLLGCQHYLDQSELEVRDFFNKSKLDKIIDDIRDYAYLRQAKPDAGLKHLFLRYTDSLDSPE